MPSLKYSKPERISLKNHPELTEKWVQERIAEDPSILGLGDLIVKDVERTLPGAGRLDLLLQDADTNHATRSKSNWARQTNRTSSGRSNTGTLSARGIRSMTTPR